MAFLRSVFASRYLVVPILALIVMTLLSLSIGSYPISEERILRFLAAACGLASMPPEQYSTLHTVLVTIRLPRVLTAILIGMALSGSGTAFQAIFRNPLVSPGILGVLGGASFGAALGMLLQGSWVEIEIVAFATGLIAVAVGVAIGSIFGSASMVTLVLGGMISSALFGALLSLVKYVADPTDQLPSIIYWLMGSLGNTGLSQIAWLSLPILAAVAVLWVLGGALDVMSMGDDEARALGVPVVAIRIAVIVAATLASALSVSVAGMIGWIGLLAPHVSRLLIGPNNRRLMPVSTLLGASFLLGADCLARSISQIEIPIGIVTECLGLPVFLLVIHRAKKGWS